VEGYFVKWRKIINWLWYNDLVMLLLKLVLYVNGERSEQNTKVQMCRFGPLLIVTVKSLDYVWRLFEFILKVCIFEIPG